MCYNYAIFNSFYCCLCLLKLISFESLFSNQMIFIYKNIVSTGLMPVWPPLPFHPMIPRLSGWGRTPGSSPSATCGRHSVRPPSVAPRGASGARSGTPATGTWSSSGRCTRACRSGGALGVCSSPDSLLSFSRFPPFFSIVSLVALLFLPFHIAFFLFFFYRKNKLFLRIFYRRMCWNLYEATQFIGIWCRLVEDWIAEWALFSGCVLILRPPFLDVCVVTKICA